MISFPQFRFRGSRSKPVDMYSCQTNKKLIALHEVSSTIHFIFITFRRYVMYFFLSFSICKPQCSIYAVSRSPKQPLSGLTFVRSQKKGITAYASLVIQHPMPNHIASVPTFFRDDLKIPRTIATEWSRHARAGKPVKPSIKRIWTNRQPRNLNTSPRHPVDHSPQLSISRPRQRRETRWAATIAESRLSTLQIEH